MLDWGIPIKKYNPGQITGHVPNFSDDITKKIKDNFKKTC